jgi:hypothetical protein
VQRIAYPGIVVDDANAVSLILPGIRVVLQTLIHAAA